MPISNDQSDREKKSQNISEGQFQNVKPEVEERTEGGEGAGE